MEKQTRNELNKVGVQLYGRGTYNVQVYQGYDKKYNKSFRNYVNAYNYMSKLINKDIMCGMDIITDKDGYIGDIGC